MEKSPLIAQLGDDKAEKEEDRAGLRSRRLLRTRAAQPAAQVAAKVAAEASYIHRRRGSFLAASVEVEFSRGGLSFPLHARPASSLPEPLFLPSQLLFLFCS